jgi:ribokinase
VVVSTERLPAPGETVTDGVLLVNHGGKGANQAVAARRLGAEVRFIGCVGDDASGAGVRARLAAEGIGVEGLATTSEAATGTAVIVVDAVGRNQIAVAPGANTRLTVEHLARRRDDLRWAEVVVCQLEIPVATVLFALRAARESGALALLDPAPVKPLPDALWAVVDYLKPNALEAERLSGCPAATVVEAGAAARALAARGPRAVIATLGDQGALICEEGDLHHVPAFPVTAVDSTAAGDAFMGALAVGLGEGRTTRAAVAFAVVAAALACTRRGAQDSLPSRAEVSAAGGD